MCIPLEKYAFKELLERFKNLIKILKFNYSADSEDQIKPITYIDLLESLDPLLGSYYRKVLEIPVKSFKIHKKFKFMPFFYIEYADIE